MPIHECVDCGSTDFLIISEKLYEGYIEDGVLICEPENEGIIEIECRGCQGNFDIGSFEEISY